MHDEEIISIAKVHGKVEAVNEAAKDEIIDQILDTDADAEAVEEVIDFLDLQPYRDKMIAGLPYGVRKVVELGRALASGPRLLAEPP